MTSVPRLSYVRSIAPARAGQRTDLYRWGERYVKVSTVPSVRGACNELVVGLAQIVDSNRARRWRDFPTDGETEETMAFECDADGLVIDWSEIVAAHGP